jgi:hypothetical protein
MRHTIGELRVGCREALIDEGESDPFLIEAYRRAIRSLDEVAVQVRLVAGQVIERLDARRRLGDLVLFVGEERYDAHERRPGVGEALSDAVEDRRTHCSIRGPSGVMRPLTSPVRPLPQERGCQHKPIRRGQATLSCSSPKSAMSLRVPPSAAM